jgi:hypothetical protein
MWIPSSWVGRLDFAAALAQTGKNVDSEREHGIIIAVFRYSGV